MQIKNSESKADDVCNNDRILAKAGEENATAEVAHLTSKENAPEVVRPATGFTRTLVAKSERPSTTTSLVQRTENLQLDGDEGTVRTHLYLIVQRENAVKS